MVSIPDRFQIPERDAAITTRAQSSLESFQTTGNHTKFPVLYIKVDETCLLKQTDIYMYIHTYKSYIKSRWFIFILSIKR